MNPTQLTGRREEQNKKRQGKKMYGNRTEREKYFHLYKIPTISFVYRTYFRIDYQVNEQNRIGRFKLTLHPAEYINIIARVPGTQAGRGGMQIQETIVELHVAARVKICRKMYNFTGNQISKIQRECLKLTTEISTPENIAVEECLELLKNSLRNTSADKIPGVLERLKSEFDKDFNSRIYAARNGAYDVVLGVLTSFENERNIIFLALKIMIRLTSCRSNLLTEDGITYQMDSLKKEKNLPNAQLLLRWMKQCCLKNEKNRQGIFNANVVGDLRNILQSEILPGSKLQDVCSLLRALTLDDDPGFDYGNSVERARDIGNETLIPITILLDKSKHKKTVVCEILQTMITLLVRNEFCKKVKDAGALNSILEAMSSFPDEENLNCLALKLIKVLTGNDDVKVHVVAQGTAPLVIAAMSRIQTEAITVSGLCCIAELTLENPKNSEIFYKYETPGLIIETMKKYPGSIDVQRYGARTISNMTVETELDSRAFLDLEVEVYLEIAMKVHGDEIEGDIQAAFSNLGLNPELKYHWTKTRDKK